jgi:hypothetical protein
MGKVLSTHDIHDNDKVLLTSRQEETIPAISPIGENSQCITLHFRESRKVVKAENRKQQRIDISVRHTFSTEIMITSHRPSIGSPVDSSPLPAIPYQANNLQQAGP